MTDIAGFIVLKAGVNRPVAEIEQECIALFREKFGAGRGLQARGHGRPAAEDALAQDPARYHEEDR